jgi:hypothetical protein
VVDLIINKNETAHREKVKALAEGCKDNNLSVNINKMKELIRDFSRERTAESARPHPHRRGCSGEGESFKLLGLHVTDDLKWSIHSDGVVKKSLGP